MTQATLSARHNDAFVYVKTAPRPVPPIRRAARPHVVPQVSLSWEDPAIPIVEIVSRAAFADARGSVARDFYARVFAVTGVKSVSVDSVEGRAEVRFDQDSSDPNTQLRRLAAVFRHDLPAVERKIVAAD